MCVYVLHFQKVFSLLSFCVFILSAGINLNYDISHGKKCEKKTFRFKKKFGIILHKIIYCSWFREINCYLLLSHSTRLFLIERSLQCLKCKTKCCYKTNFAQSKNCHEQLKCTFSLLFFSRSLDSKLNGTIFFFTYYHAVQATQMVVDSRAFPSLKAIICFREEKKTANTRFSLTVILP